VIEGVECGIDYDNTKNTYTFYVRRYLEDFKFAVNNYVSELMTDVAKFTEAKKALDEDPKVRAADLNRVRIPISLILTPEF
jgi:hypothetical protein